MKFKLLTLTSIALFFGACSPNLLDDETGVVITDNTVAQNGSISGTVYQGETNNKLSKVGSLVNQEASPFVTLYKSGSRDSIIAILQTDNQGAFSFEKLKLDTFDIVVELENEGKKLGASRNSIILSKQDTARKNLNITINIFVSQIFNIQLPDNKKIIKISSKNSYTEAKIDKNQISLTSSLSDTTYFEITFLEDAKTKTSQFMIFYKDAKWIIEEIGSEETEISISSSVEISSSVLPSSSSSATQIIFEPVSTWELPNAYVHWHYQYLEGKILKDLSGNNHPLAITQGENYSTNTASTQESQVFSAGDSILPSSISSGTTRIQIRSFKNNDLSKAFPIIADEAYRMTLYWYNNELYWYKNNDDLWQLLKVAFEWPSDELIDINLSWGEKMELTVNGKVLGSNTMNTPYQRTTRNWVNENNIYFGHYEFGTVGVESQFKDLSPMQAFLLQAAIYPSSSSKDLQPKKINMILNDTNSYDTYLDHSPGKKTKNYGQNLVTTVGSYDDNSRFRTLLKIIYSDSLQSKTIQDVKLTLKVQDWTSKHVNSTLPIDVHKMLVPWEEGSAFSTGWEGILNSAEINGSTYYERVFGVKWDVEFIGLNDVDASSNAFTSSEIEFGVDNTISFDITELTRSWLSNPETNHGIVMRLPSEFETGNKLTYPMFHSTEAKDEINRPRLSITYLD